MLLLCICVSFYGTYGQRAFEPLNSSAIPSYANRIQTLSQFIHIFWNNLFLFFFQILCFEIAFFLFLNKCVAHRNEQVSVSATTRQHAPCIHFHSEISRIEAIYHNHNNGRLIRRLKWLGDVKLPKCYPLAHIQQYIRAASRWIMLYVGNGGISAVPQYAGVNDALA